MLQATSQATPHATLEATPEATSDTLNARSVQSPLSARSGARPARSLMLPLLLAPMLALAACGDRDANERQVADLDAQLSGSDSDPALNAALNDPILVDPDLTDQANRNALRAPPAAASGAVPPDDGYDGDKASTAEIRQALSGQTLRQAPEPRTMAADECTDCGADAPRTLGARAQRQAARNGASTGGCTAKLGYDARWANRMPAAFPLFPKARVREAAGVSGGACDIRVVSFTTGNPVKDVVDFYYSRARAAGYDAEYVIRQGDHALGGTRGDDAYYITFAQRANGGTAVDIVANAGR